MDADAHRRAAQEDDDQIRHWQDQITLEKKESDIRIQSYLGEIEKHKQSKSEHLEAAKQWDREEEHRKKMMRMADMLTRAEENAE